MPAMSSALSVRRGDAARGERDRKHHRFGREDATAAALAQPRFRRAPNGRGRSCARSRAARRSRDRTGPATPAGATDHGNAVLKKMSDSTSAPVVRSTRKLVAASTRSSSGRRSKAERRQPIVAARERGGEPAELIGDRRASAPPARSRTRGRRRPGNRATLTSVAPCVETAVAHRRLRPLERDLAPADGDAELQIRERRLRAGRRAAAPR